MVLFIHQDALDEARRIHVDGDTLGSWKVLASYGDSYARATCHIAENKPSFWTYFRHAHWEGVTKTDMDSALWHKAGHASLGHYLDATESQREEHFGETLYRLPNSMDIERCHIQSTSSLNIPRESIIHLVSNSVTTRFNRFVGLSDGPDWHEPLSERFGKMGCRGIDSSDQFSEIGFWNSFFLLAKSASVGAARFARFRTQGVLNQYGPHMNFIIG